MTDLLDALSDRAGRATPDPDIETMIGDAVTRGHHLVHRRRAATAGAGGALALGVAAAVLVAIFVPGGSDDKNEIQPLSPPEPRTTSSAPSASATALVAAPAAPKKAPVSLGLIPSGWVYFGADQAVTEYRAATDRTPSSVDVFENKIVVGPHDDGTTLSKADYPERVGKYDASYGASDGSQMVSLLIKGSTTVDFQIPATAKLDKATALRMAASIQIRDLSHPSHG